MRLFLDECLSPQIALELNAMGHYAVHPRNQGGIGDPDHVVLSRALRDNLVIVTANARDFRSLVAREDIHPGLIVLPSTSRERSKTLLLAAISVLEARGEPDDLMVNHVLEVEQSHDGTAQTMLYPVPSDKCE